MAYTCYPSTQEAEAGHHEFEVRLSYIAKSCLTQINKQNPKTPKQFKSPSRHRCRDESHLFGISVTSAYPLTSQSWAPPLWFLISLGICSEPIEYYTVIKYTVLILGKLTNKNKLENFWWELDIGNVGFSKKFEDHRNRRYQRYSSFRRIL
jgi:hypothetical protein